MILFMQTASSTATQPSLLSTVQQIAGISPAKRSDNKLSVSGHSDEGRDDGKTASAVQNGTVQTGTSRTSTQRGSVVNLLV
jgi:hypothetical protein